MKGLFAVMEFMHFVAVLLLVPFVFYWKFTVINCRTGYSFLHTLIWHNSFVAVQLYS